MSIATILLITVAIIVVCVVLAFGLYGMARCATSIKEIALIATIPAFLGLGVAALVNMLV